MSRRTARRALTCRVGATKLDDAAASARVTKAAREVAAWDELVALGEEISARWKLELLAAEVVSGQRQGRTTDDH